MKLYYAPGVCSLAVHIALNELDATYDLEKVDLATKETDFEPNGAIGFSGYGLGSRRAFLVSLPD